MVLVPVKKMISEISGVSEFRARIMVYNVYQVS